MSTKNKNSIINDSLEDYPTQRVAVGTLPYVEIGDIEINTKSASFKDKASVAGAVLCPEDSVIVSKVRPNRGAIALIGKSVAISSAFTILKPNAGKCLPKYLFYQLAWNTDFLNYLQSHSTGATYPIVKEKDILGYPINLPDLTEQERIVAILEEAEKLKQKRAEADQKMSELIPALFVKMFGDPISNPKQWGVVPLSELGSLDRGKSQHRPRTAPELFGGHYPFVQTGDITNAGLRIKKYTQTYSEKGLAQSRLWSKNTLCITIAANIAKTAILDFEACFPDSVVGFIANENSNPDYVQGLFHFYQQALEEAAPKAAQRNINLQILRNLKVPKPPVSLQNQFAEAVKEIEVQKEKQKQSAVHINSLFSSLLDKSYG